MSKFNDLTVNANDKLNNFPKFRISVSTTCTSQIFPDYFKEGLSMF